METCKRSERRCKRCIVRSFYQSVSKTTAVCPRNKGNCSGNRPFSLMGMTANAPPPLASQLTDIYCGFAFVLSDHILHIPMRVHHLYEVRIPSISGDPYVIVALFLSKGSASDRSLLSYLPIAPSLSAGRRHALGRILAHGRCRKESCMGRLRYLDERTKRPDICAHALRGQTRVEWVRT